MTVDELIKQIINAQLAEKIAEDYKKFNSNFDKLDKRIISNSEEISKSKSDIKAYSDTIKDLEQKIGKFVPLETFLKLNENQKVFAQEIRKQISELIFASEKKTEVLLRKIDDLEDEIAIIKKHYKELENNYYDNSKKISTLESKNNDLFQKINKKEPKSTVMTPSRNELFEPTDTVINSFNNWASCPNLTLPPEFTYVTGDFRIRTNQQEFTETQEKTKWIINRRGTKTYLLPNPNSFDQMTNLDLYEMDLNMLKGKGKNKIKIITPCEISSSGFIEFMGKLQILH